MCVIIYQPNTILSNDKTLVVFLHTMLHELYKSNPEKRFIQLSYDYQSPVIQPNLTLHTLRAPWYNSVFKRMWLKQQIKSHAKKTGASLIFSINEAINVSLPNCIFLTTLSKHTVANAQLADTVLTPSLYFSERLVQKGISTSKIKTIRPWPLAIFKTLDWDKREQVKEQISAGCEYILVDAAMSNIEQLIQVLKSFSLFKKWQKTNIRLLIVHLKHPTVETMLQNYKYREDVTLLSTTDYAAQPHLIMAAAWLFLHVPVTDTSGIALMQAAECGTPVITHKTGAIEETMGDGAAYIEIENIESLAETMITLYKNEKIRNQYIQNAQNRNFALGAQGLTDLWTTMKKTTEQANERIE